MSQNFAIIETGSGKIHAVPLSDTGRLGQPLCGARYRVATMFAIIGGRKGTADTFGCPSCRAQLPADR